MSDRDLQLRLLRHLSMEKRAWYGAASGKQAPQLPQVGGPEPSEAPAIGRPAMGGTLAAQAANKAADSAALIQQNLAEKMQPLKQPAEPIRPASQPTARQRNDRMARQVTQPAAGKTSLAHVVSPRGIDKTAQSESPPDWRDVAARRSNTWVDDAQKALGSPMQTLREGFYEIPGIGRPLRKADAWMGKKVGRDPATFLSQEVVQPAARAVAKGLTTKIPGVRASVAEGMEALGQGMIGMPLTTPVGLGLRAGAAELQAAGRAARALPGALRAGSRAAGQAALRYGDDLAAKAFPGLGQDLAYAGGRAAAATESRLASSASRGPRNVLMSKAEPFEVWRTPARAAPPAPAATPPATPAPAPSAAPPALPAPAAPAAEGAAAQAARPSGFNKLTGGGGSRLPPTAEGGGREVVGRIVEKAEGRPPAYGPELPRNFVRIGRDAKELRKQVSQADPTGRGAGALADNPEAMRQLLGPEGMNYSWMSRPERLARRVSAAVLRPFNQIPTPGLGRQGAGLSTEGGAGPWISRQFYNATRSIPVVGPQRYGGAGLLRSPETGKITLPRVGLTAGGLGYAGYEGSKAVLPYARAAGDISRGAPVARTLREVNDPRAETARRAQEQLEKMSPAEIRAYMAPGGAPSTRQ
jgi:hypothetical protein